MVRQRSCNTLEEVYGPKFDATKSQANSSSKNPKDHGYIITSSLPYNTATKPVSASLSPATMNTSRRKSARPNMKAPLANNHKCLIKDEKDDIISRKENSTKLKSTRGNYEKKWQQNLMGSNQFDNKPFRSTNDNRKDPQSHGDGYGQHQNQNHSHHQNHNHGHHNHNNHRHSHHHLDEDKDDDTEEFFELIRQTVEGAIGKCIPELLSCSFRELYTKIDRFSIELKNTNEMLNKIQVDLNKKIIHYGEENSRHFRYLCMKSEYDKMFYQHQTMMTAQVVPSDTSQTAEGKSSASKTSAQQPRQKKSKEDIDDAPCTCRSTVNQPGPNKSSKDPHKSSSDENNVCQKISEMVLREVLDHIQRICTQMQMGDQKIDMGSKAANGKDVNDGSEISQLADKYIRANGINLDTEMFRRMAYDDEELAISSDGMTPRSEDELKMPNYVGMTMRAENSTRGGICGGGGDA